MGEEKRTKGEHEEKPEDILASEKNKEEAPLKDAGKDEKPADEAASKKEPAKKEVQEKGTSVAAAAAAVSAAEKEALKSGLVKTEGAVTEPPAGSKEAAGATKESTEGESLPAKGLSKKAKKVLFISLAVLALLLVGVTAYGMVFFNQVQEPSRVLLGDHKAAPEDEEQDVGAYFPDHIVNIGLLGFDRGWNRESYGEYLFRPDMLALLTIDFEQDKIAVVRVPRDSYVPIHGAGGFHDKINHSYYYGYRSGATEDAHADGILNALNTLSDVLGQVPIHYYVSVDMYSIVELVDAVGGVYYDSEQEIIDKHWEVGRVLVPKGLQLMDGKTYLRYLQYRDDATNQDYGRIDRQMNLLKETFFYLREQGKITDLPTIYRIYKDYVETDLTYKQIAALAYYAAEFEPSDDNLSFHTLTGDGQMKDGIWYQVLFQAKRVEIIKDVFGLEAEKWAPIVLIDSPEYLEEQERLQREEAFGFSFDDDDFKFPRFSRDEEEGSAKEETAAPALEVLVPELRGKTVSEARYILADKGLKLGDVRERGSDLLEPGLVLFSEPLPGMRVKEGTTVILTIAKPFEVSSP